MADFMVQEAQESGVLPSSGFLVRYETAPGIQPNHCFPVQLINSGTSSEPIFRVAKNFDFQTLNQLVFFTLRYVEPMPAQRIESAADDVHCFVPDESCIFRGSKNLLHRELFLFVLDEFADTAVNIHKKSFLPVLLGDVNMYSKKNANPAFVSETQDSHLIL